MHKCNIECLIAAAAEGLEVKNGRLITIFGQKQTCRDSNFFSLSSHSRIHVPVYRLS